MVVCYSSNKKLIQSALNTNWLNCKSTLNWKVALQMWKEGQKSGGLFLSGPGESVEPFLGAPSAHLCRDRYSGLPCSEVPPMDSARLTMPIPGLKISPFPVCLQTNLFWNFVVVFQNYKLIYALTKCFSCNSDEYYNMKIEVTPANSQPLISDLQR